MSVRRVLIVGGGIGGLTAAVALRRAGITAEIVESNAAWSVYGVGIIQPSNMLRALAKVGLGERCLELGAGFPGWHIHDRNGNLLVEVPNQNVAGPGYPPVNGITRPELHRVLKDAVLAQGTAVRLGVTVADWTDQGSHVDVRFTDGTAAAYDLVIGVDGAHSMMRRRLLGAGIEPQPTGQSVWRYNLPRPPEVVWGGIYYGTRSKAGLVPLSRNLMYIFLVTSEPGAQRMPEDRLHTLLQDRLAEYGGLIAQLRPLITDPGQVVYRPMETVLAPPPWHRGRVVLIGDAAHAGTPHLAQGAAMAIEDAVLLAEMLGAQGELATTLDAFVARRLPRCRLVLDVGLQMGRWELAEWSGTPDPQTDHGGLMHRSLTELMRPM